MAFRTAQPRNKNSLQLNNYATVTSEFRTTREAPSPERARGAEQFPIREYGDDYADIACRALSAIAIRDACSKR